MKEYYKKPNFYYVLIPVIAGVWMITVWMLTLPTAEKKWQQIEEQYTNAQKQIDKIPLLDADRLDYEKQKSQSGEFDYSNTVEQFAKLWKIPSTKYDLQVRRETKRGKRKTKSANISIKDVDIETFSQFLSTLLLRWPDLQCDQLKLTKMPAGPDSWKANLKLTYNY